MREDRSDADLLEQRHGEHRDALALADPPHPLVRLRFHGDGRVAAHERAGKVLAHVVQIARESGLLDDHRDVGAREADSLDLPKRADPRGGEAGPPLARARTTAAGAEHPTPAPGGASGTAPPP